MKHRQLIRFALDMGPLLVFFLAYKIWDIFGATAAFMGAITIALAVGYWMERKLSPMPLFTAFFVLLLGSLTLYLKDETFIKIKMTVVYTFFAVMLIGGLFLNRLLIKYVFSEAFSLTDKGWRALTWRWAFFFLAVAITNEVVWRNFSTAFWINFKVWGIVPLFFLFALSQTPLILAHEKKDEPPQT